MALFTGSDKEKNSRKSKKTLGAMIKGYKEMGRINVDLAEGCIDSDNDALEGYEQFLAESERSDSKTRRHILR